MRTITSLGYRYGVVTAYTEDRGDGRRVIRTGDGVYCGTAWPVRHVSTYDGVAEWWNVEDIDGRVTGAPWLASAVRRAVAVATQKPTLTVESHGEALVIPTRVAAAFRAHREHRARVAGADQ
ncbi:hypothetical protein Bcav_2513 [Beutenbergia cavernae DSM 12333]|uniref:Uncharacterized protein n=1 Tax=Beutenbergia cavernae (strain ATCC BAA-8 / DSM 12333 / CCUG 43141 / JCM 11478 / NBRC 16432 / NCIMB 13614 / HKI 0122) TaxID=471853 RepID=C5BWU6_BEUC1|nr:hypothetical protein [Beutenbergia cavernae]ACQ80762.1 hypothetical protein Bcav_2513 [Beutenbergia cavernae DSM 12333]